MKFIYKIIFLLLLIAVVVGISVLSFRKNTTILKGTVQTITENNILLDSDGMLYSVSFEKKIKEQIEVGFLIEIRIEKNIAESYPMQAKGYKIKVIKEEK